MDSSRGIKSKSAWVAAVMLLVGSLGVGSASGIVYGEADGGDHSYVGSLVAEVPWEGEIYVVQFCTGTLLDAEVAVERAVFLTAAHCVFDLDTYFPPGSEIYVTFDATIADSVEQGAFFGPLEFDPAQAVGDIFYDPRFNTHGMSDQYDVAVVLLEGGDLPDSAATLPAAGYLDSLKKSGDLKHARFTTVGYGTTRDTKRKAFASIDFSNVARNRADQGFMSLTNAWLSLAMNDRAVENGGTCYGDSGGPHFYEDTSLIVSLTVTGDVPCKAVDKTYRLDTPSARDFLSQYVVLP